MERPPRTITLPELFLGLLALAVAAIVVAYIVTDTVRDIRHTRDTLSVTASAKVPITANLVRWSLTVHPEAGTPSAAARRLRGQVQAVRRFLKDAGIDGDAVSVDVVATEENVIPLPHKRRKTVYVVSQRLEIRTKQIDVVEQAATGVGSLLERGIAVSASPLAYISTELTKAKLKALEQATEEAHHRAEILVHGLGGKLGRMRSSSQGVYQVTPRDSTDVSDYGINDTSSRDKDVNAVVSATFAVNR